MFTKKTLLMWLLIATINSACNEGCVRCGPEDKCQTCDLQLGWKLVGDSCQRNVDTKCILNGAQDSCLLCNQNFFYDATQKKCVRSSRRLSLCLHMQDNKLCDVCIKGYYPLDGVCTLVNKPIENCKYHRDSIRCLQCEENYWPSSDFTKCLNTPNSDLLDNCKYYSNVYCEKCKDGKVPNPNSYIYNLFSEPNTKMYQNFVQNMQFQYSDNVIDTQCEDVKVDYCKVYKNATECSQCNNGYYLQEGKCIINPYTIIDHCVIYSAYNKCQQCEPQYYPHNEQKECRKADTTIENCLIRNLQSCIQCNDGYYKDVSQCVQQVKIDNCQTYSTTQAKCVTCVEPYRLTSDNEKCLEKITNCKTYASSNKNDASFTCTSCTNGTYLDANKQCVDGQVIACLEYQTNGTTCQKCTNEYYLSGNQCLRHTNIDNCDLYSNTLKDTCIQCKNDHFLMNLEKVCYAAFEILNCIAYSSRDNCSKCDQGYYLDSNQCIIIPETEHCLERNAPGTDCLKCQDGYYINNNATPKVCLQNFEQQTLGCFTQSTSTNVDRHLCSVCKGNHYFIDLKSLSDQTNYEGNVCGKIDRIPEAQRVDNCVAYIDTGANVWKCLRCATNYYLSDQSGNSGNYGDTCSQTCNNTIVVLETDLNASNGTTLITLEKFKDFRINICKTLPNQNDQCEYWVPINDVTASGTSLQYQCGKKKSSSNYVMKLNYAAGQESSYGFDNNFSIPNKHGYAAPTYTLDDSSINSSYPNINYDKCQSWKVDPAGNNDKYCDKCIHQYSSESTVQNAGNEQQTSYLKCDTLIPDCETDVLGGFIYDQQVYTRHLVNPLHVSCHSCSSANQIPFIHLPLDGDAKWSTQWYQPFKVEQTTAIPKDSPVKDGLITECREPTAEGLSIDTNDFTRQFPSNCGMGLYNVSISKTFKDTDNLTDVSVYCLACKPGFKAVYNNDGFLANCEEIANCQKITTQSVDKFVNGCAICDLGYNYGFDNITKKIQFDECVLQTIPNCLVSQGTSCVYCQKGYYLENDKTCNKLIVPKCVNYNYVNYDFYNLNNSSQNVLQFQTSFALFMTAMQKGCQQCTSNYYQLYNYPLEAKQCVSSQNLIEQQYENSSHLIQNCALYEGNQVQRCYRCNSLYIPNQDYTKCILQTPFKKCAQVQEQTLGQYICTKCESGFYLIKNNCVRGTITNCTNYNPSVLPQKCIECVDQYRVSRDGLSCILGNLPYCKQYENTFETKCKICEDQEHSLTTVNNLFNTNQMKRCFRNLQQYNCKDVNSTKTESSIYNCNECKQGFYQSDVDSTSPKTMCVSISPIDNCKTYDYLTNTKYSERSHKCIECQSGFYVSEYGFSCKPRDPTIEFCTEFEKDSLKCKTCDVGFYLSENKMECSANPTGVKNCAEYSSATTCLRCSNNYYLNNNLCLEVDKNLQLIGCLAYNEAQLCVQCSQNYYFDSSNNTCNDPNASGCLTYTDINTCQTCPEGTVFQDVQQGDTLIKNCIQYNLQFCLDIDSLTRRCKLCSTNYYIQEDGTCAVAELIPNCLYYDSANECQQCDTGFYRTANKKECFQTGFHLMNNYGNCLDVVYKDQQQCVACQDGMYFKDGKCVSCEVQNCLACNPRVPTQCLICKSGYTQNLQYGKCTINLEDVIVLPGEDDGTDTETPNNVNILTIITLLLVTIFN